MERVTGIEPALSAWEAVPSGLVTWPDLQGGVSASDRERPLFTGVNGPLMARGSGSLISPSLDSTSGVCRKRRLTAAGINRVFAVLALESEPVDPGLPRLHPLRHGGEPCFFTEQLTKLIVQPGTLTSRFPLPGQSHASEVFPPYLPCPGSLLPKLRILLLQDSQLRLDTLARLRKCGDLRARLFQPGAESRQLLGHHRLTFQRSPAGKRRSPGGHRSREPPAHAGEPHPIPNRIILSGRAARGASAK